MTDYTKQETIYLLSIRGIPFELINIINSYVFYDIYVSNHRKKTKQITESIQKSDHYTIRDSIWLRRWGMNIHAIYKKNTLIELQYQTQFCIQCGDYTIINNVINNNHIMCNCIHLDNEKIQYFEEEDRSNIDDYDDYEADDYMDYWDNYYEADYYYNAEQVANYREGI